MKQPAKKMLHLTKLPEASNKNSDSVEVPERKGRKNWRDTEQERLKGRSSEREDHLLADLGNSPTRERSKALESASSFISKLCCCSEDLIPLSADLKVCAEAFPHHTKQDCSTVN